MGINVAWKERKMGWEVLYYEERKVGKMERKKWRESSTEKGKGGKNSCIEKERL